MPTPRWKICEHCKMPITYRDQDQLSGGTNRAAPPCCGALWSAGLVFKSSYPGASVRLLAQSLSGERWCLGIDPGPADSVLLCHEHMTNSMAHNASQQTG